MRPQILFPLFAPIRGLRGVGPRIEPLVERAAGPLVRDLVFLAPHGVIHRATRVAAEALEGETARFVLTIGRHVPPERSGRPYVVRAYDATGEIDLVWFKGHGAHLAASHPPGSHRAVSGRVDRHRGGLSLAHPEYMLPADRLSDIPETEAVYPTTAGLAPRTVRRLVHEALLRAPDLEEWQDPAWIGRMGWMSWRQALAALHAPADAQDLSPRHPARLRLAYDELLAHQLAMVRRKARARRAPARSIASSALAAAVEKSLPFALTTAQARTLTEVRGDLASGARMSRIIQGDVGSGKTVVAMLAMADVAAAGRQSALMAPTEILARQHYETLVGPLERAGLAVATLTGRDKGRARAAKLEAIGRGEVQVVVGTHALFQDGVSFSDLTLAVVDEQHRFGVFERGRLQGKGEAVHLLALSATPIPRTLELTLFGDLDVSKLDEKPPGRLPATTTAAPFRRLDHVVERLSAAVKNGAQAFWICPLVAESETLDVTAAETRAEHLRGVLGPRVGLVHGQMSAAEKDHAMAAFVDGQTDVLVATTVVEVGVDVPRASIIVIEHAERFGLAQLHQLRGRVGRGGGASACLLLYDPPLTTAAQARLDVLRRTDDGFLIAEKDLELRGGGDLLGAKQSGFPDYRFADPLAHRDLLLAAADDARLALARDPGLNDLRGRRLRILQALFDWRADEDWAAAG